MLQVEIQNKLSLTDFTKVSDDQDAITNIDISRMEDVLTDNVFGIIKNLDVMVINEILTTAKLPVKFDTNPDFVFWKKYNDDYTEPDIIIHDNKICIIVEVKYLSPFDKGNKVKSPQIVREIEGIKLEYPSHKFYYLAVTKDECQWESSVDSKYIPEIKKYKKQKLLYSIQWHQIYEVIKGIISKNSFIEQVTKRFLNDLVEYLENKNLIEKEEDNTKNRTLVNYFGEEINDLELFIQKICVSEKNLYVLYLDSFDLDTKIELYKKIIEYINNNGTRFRPLNNLIDKQLVTSDLLLIDDFDEIDEWTRFINFLYKNKFVCLNGKLDISVKLKNHSGEYANREVSFFTYYIKKRRMTFLRVR